MRSRDLFEHWMITDAPPCGKGKRLIMSNGRYLSSYTQLAWEAWKAAPKEPDEVRIDMAGKWPKFANGKRGCHSCGAYANPVTGEVKHERGCENGKAI